MRGAFIYQADIYCYGCGRELQDEIHFNGFERTEDSDTWPQGPHANGGGEADSPQHCRACGLFLKNPLTDEGERYARQRIADHYKTGKGSAEVIKEWEAYYRFEERGSEGAAESSA